MPFRTDAVDDSRASGGGRIRLALAVVAIVLSFASVLRTRMVPMNDLYSRWYGTRELILHSRSPYSAEVSQEIETAFYGHMLGPGEERDEQRFAYPAYVVFLIWPMAFASFHTVSAISLVLLILAGAGIVICCERFLGWPRMRNDRLAAVLIGLSTSPMLRGFRLEQLSTLVVLFLAGALLGLASGRQRTAGILLALATIKPQMALLTVLWLLLWSVSRWRERKKFAITFLLSMAVLLSASELWVPGWIVGFPRQLGAYSRYAGHESLLSLLAGPTIGWLACLVVAGFTLKIVWPHRFDAGASRGFQFSSSLVMAVSALVMPTMAAQHNLVLAIPAALVVLREFHSLASGLKVLLAVLLAWTPTMGLLTLFHDVEWTRLLQMSAGFVIAVVVVITMLCLSRRLAADSQPELRAPA